jgi:hypothetical protein
MTALERAAQKRLRAKLIFATIGCMVAGVVIYLLA